MTNLLNLFPDHRHCRYGNHVLYLWLAKFESAHGTRALAGFNRYKDFGTFTLVFTQGGLSYPTSGQKHKEYDEYGMLGDRMKRCLMVVLGLILILSSVSGCNAPSPTMPNSKDIALSSKDISADIDLMGMIPNADYTGEIKRSYGRPAIVVDPKDIRDGYKIVFSGQSKFLGRTYVSIYSISNAVAVYKSEQKARTIFAEANPIPVDLKLFGAEWNVPTIGDEAKGWQENIGYSFNYYLFFRKGRVLVSLSTMGWVGQAQSEGRMMAQEKTISLARLAEGKIPVDKQR